MGDGELWQGEQPFAALLVAEWIGIDEMEKGTRACLRWAGSDAESYTGLAFGIGVGRIAKLKYGIDDIRMFDEDDVRFLSRF